MESEGLAPIVIETFAYYYRQVVAGETGLIRNRDIACFGCEGIDHRHSAFAAGGGRPVCLCRQFRQPGSRRRPGAARILER